jgi:hypothetical protein
VFSESTIALISLLAFALFSNIPLGYLREDTERYSLRWFVYIHLSIPLIVALRYSLGFGWNIIPFSIACAIAGQVIGGRARKRRAS